MNVHSRPPDGLPNVKWVHQRPIITHTHTLSLSRAYLYRSFLLSLSHIFSRSMFNNWNSFATLFIHIKPWNYNLLSVWLPFAAVFLICVALSNRFDSFRLLLIFFFLLLLCLCAVLVIIHSIDGMHFINWNRYWTTVCSILRMCHPHPNRIISSAVQK